MVTTQQTKRIRITGLVLAAVAAAFYLGFIFIMATQ